MKTIRQYCEQTRPHDDLVSLYSVLYCQFEVRPDDLLSPFVKELLDSLPA